jgi:hypothetical protein
VQLLSGQSYCTKCDAGRFENSGTCEDCASGRFQDVAGQSTCLECGACAVGARQACDGAGAGYCTSCAPGSFANAETGSCQDCVAQTITTAKDQSACTPCPAGSVQPLSGQSYCTKCDAGRFEDGGVCKDCVGGRFQNATSQTACTDCGALACDTGARLNCGGSTEGFCSDCPAGKFFFRESETASGCKDCPAGSWCQSGKQFPCGGTNLFCPPNSASPTSVALGHFSVPTNASEDHRMGQKACEAGFSCAKGVNQKCPLGRVCHVSSLQARVFAAGGEEITVNITTESLCADNQFVYEGACVACPERGAECSNGIIELLPEHWYDAAHGPLVEFWGKRSKGELSEDTNIYRCAKGSCTTDKVGLPDCRDGRTGLLCAVCSDGFYVTDSLACKACPTGASAAQYGVVLLFLITLGGALWVAKRKIEAHHPKLAAAIREKLPEVLKLLTGLMQILGSFTSVLYRVPWPGAFSSITNVFSFVNLDVFSLPSLRCSDFGSSYFARFTLHVSFMLGTTALFAALLFYAYSEHNVKHGKFVKTSTVWNTFLPFLFLIYPSISKTVILMLRCRTIDGTGYLLSDISVSCETAKYAAHRNYAIFGVLVFPIGIVVFFTALVGYNRHKLPPDWWPAKEAEQKAAAYEVHCAQCNASASDGGASNHISDWEAHADTEGNTYFWSETLQQSSWVDPSAAGTDGVPFAEWEAQCWAPQMAKYDKIYKRTGFLTSTYKQHYWWFEALVTIYKLAMTVLVMFVSGGDENKILFGMVGATAMMAVFSFYQPFRHPDILSINTVAQLIILLVLFAAQFLLVNGGGSIFIAFTLVCLTLAPLVAGVVLTLRLPEDAIVREAGDALSKDFSDAMAKTLSAPKLSGMLGSFRRRKNKKSSLKGKHKGRPSQALVLGGESTANPVMGEAGGFSEENPMHSSRARAVTVSMPDGSRL